ncbi:MAG: hypothetical protein ACOVSW_16460 [Candidatus Kapaibacteriota bacterium]
MKVFLFIIVFCLATNHQLFSQTPKKEYAFEEVMQIAARLFFPSAEDTVRGIKTSICDNDKCFVDTERGIDAELKRFCFTTIENDLLKKQEGEEAKQVLAEYSAICKKIAKMNWSSNSTTRIQRMQGAIWYAWSNSSLFQSLVWKRYLQEQAKLPFSIKK